MLAAIIANLQNVQPGPQPRPTRPPTVHVDRGGAGPSWPGYSIVDILGALDTFREIPGEHPVARAQRRHRHIGDHLSGIRELRENREAAAFLAGATLAAREAEERAEERFAVDVAAMVKIIDDVRGVPATAIANDALGTGELRGAYAAPGGGHGAGIALFLGGLAIGLLVARRR